MSPDQSSSRREGLATFIGMAAVAGAIGFGAGLLGAYIGANFLRNDCPGFGALVGAVSGMTIGYPVGVITGITVVNKRLHYEGSLWRGILGAILGTVLAIGLAEPLNLNLNPNLLFTGFFLAPPLLGIIGLRWFYLKPKRGK
jgi:hypothetical protein